MIFADPLHVLWLGIARDFVTSILLLLLRAGPVPMFGGKNLEECEHAAFLHFHAWCCAEGKTISIDGFGLSIVGREKSAGFSHVVKGKVMVPICFV